MGKKKKKHVSIDNELDTSTSEIDKLDTEIESSSDDEKEPLDNPTETPVTGESEKSLTKSVVTYNVLSTLIHDGVQYFLGDTITESKMTEKQCRYLIDEGVIRDVVSEGDNHELSETHNTR